MTDALGIAALQEFAKWAIQEGAFQAADLDGLSIQEKAHELGLIESTTYNPEQHGSSDAAETGDEWFVFAPILNAAGFRIIGPDEVDQVTLERAAAVAECHSDERSRHYSMDWSDGYIDGCRGAAAAIRATKEEGDE